MKTLYIDFEQGYKSLGNKDEIEKMKSDAQTHAKEDE